MNQENAYKYTDRQVREDFHLYEQLAAEYVTNYTGEFDLLLSYQLRIQAGLLLTVPMIRATLNCMRFDAQVTGLPEPKYEVNNVTQVDFAAKRRKPPVKWWMKEENPYVPPKPLYIELKTTWNKTYGISTWASAMRVHRVNPNSYFEYDTQTKEFNCKLWWRCKPGAYSMGKVPIELLNEVEAAAVVMSWPGWQLCRTCHDPTRFIPLRNYNFKVREA